MEKVLTLAIDSLQSESQRKGIKNIQIKQKVAALTHNSVLSFKFFLDA